MPNSMWEESGSDESLTNSISSIPFVFRISGRVGQKKGEKGRKVEARVAKPGLGVEAKDRRCKSVVGIQ